MPDATLYLRPLTATDALNKMLEIGRAVFAAAPVNLTLSTDVPGLALTINGVPINDQTVSHTEISKVLSVASGAKGAAPVMCGNFRIMQPGQSQNGANVRIDYEMKDPSMGQITLDGWAGPERIVFARNAIADACVTVPRFSLVSDAIAEPQRSALKHQEVVVAELQSVVAKLCASGTDQLGKYDEFFVRVAEKHDADRRELELRFKDKQASLAEEHSARIAEVERIRRDHAVAHAKAEQDLELRKKAVEARDNTFVRRDLHEKLNAIVADQKNAKLSPDTVKKRLPIHVACITTAVVGLGLVGFFGYVVSKDGVPALQHMIPLSASFALLVSTVVYYLRWNDQWFREHAAAEFGNKKLASDVVRASWLAELVFEIKEKDRQLPDLLISRFSEGLFLDAHSGATEHPADQLVDLIKKVSTVKIGKDAIELTKEASKEK